MLVPVGVPLNRSRADQFDDVVREAVAHLDHRWSAELAEVEFVVDEVPPTELDEDSADAADQAAPATVDLVEADEDDGLGLVRLSRLLPASGSGRNTRPPQIVLYRRPLELRALDQDDLAELVLDVLIHEVATCWGSDPRSSTRRATETSTTRTDRDRRPLIPGKGRYPR